MIPEGLKPFVLPRAAVEVDMLDLMYIALTIVFFLVALAYVRGCEKLQ